MLETIAVVLVILWLLGMVSGYTLGNFIYILLVIAVVLIPGATDQRPNGLTRQSVAGRDLQEQRRFTRSGAVPCVRPLVVPDSSWWLPRRAWPPNHGHAREHECGRNRHPRRERLVQQHDAERDGDDRIDVGIQRDERDGQMSQRVRVCNEATDRANC